MSIALEGEIAAPAPFLRRVPAAKTRPFHFRHALELREGRQAEDPAEADVEACPHEGLTDEQVYIVAKRHAFCPNHASSHCAACERIR
jgi:hypothetical protein